MISIVFPTLNEAKGLRSTLESINRLTLPHEVIVSDGKSTDETVAIARQMGATVVEHDGSHRQTIAEGRNMGAAAATGDILVFLDADCTISDPDAFFAEVQRIFAAEPNVVAIAPSIRILPEVATFADRIFSEMLNLGHVFVTTVLRGGSSPGECQMVRRSAFDAVKGYNPSLVTTEDLDLFARLSKVGRVRFVRRLVVWHTGRRVHKIGWPRLLYIYATNYLSRLFRGKPVAAEWKVIR